MLLTKDAREFSVCLVDYDKPVTTINLTEVNLVELALFESLFGLENLPDLSVNIQKHMAPYLKDVIIKVDTLKWIGRLTQSLKTKLPTMTVPEIEKAVIEVLYNKYTPPVYKPYGFNNQEDMEQTLTDPDVVFIEYDMTIDENTKNEYSTVGIVYGREVGEFGKDIEQVYKKYLEDLYNSHRDKFLTAVKRKKFDYVEYRHDKPHGYDIEVWLKNSHVPNIIKSLAWYTNTDEESYSFWGSPKSDFRQPNVNEHNR